MSLDYQIVVPSRKRVHNMLRIRSLLPTALIVVDEAERAEYRALVPAERMLCHPGLRGVPRIRNFMAAQVKSKILVEIDDDLERVLVTTGSLRRITDPTDILAIIENAARCCQDLGLTVFCWSRTANLAILSPDTRPINPVHPVANAFGIMGAARHREFNPTMTGRADLDWTLETLMRDRIVFADTRFYFDCGRIFAGRGGAVGQIDKETFERTTRAIGRKWGEYVTFKTPNYVKKKGSVSPMRIKVSRTNPTAQR